MNWLRASRNDLWPLSVLSEPKGGKQAEQLWPKKQKPLTCVPLAPEKGKQTRHCHTEQCPLRSLLVTALSVLCVCKREGGAVHLWVQLTFRHGWERMWKSARMRVQHDTFSITQKQSWWVGADWDRDGTKGLFFFNPKAASKSFTDPACSLHRFYLSLILALFVKIQSSHLGSQRSKSCKCTHVNVRGLSSSSELGSHRNPSWPLLHNCYRDTTLTDISKLFSNILLTTSLIYKNSTALLNLENFSLLCVWVCITAINYYV